MEQEIKTNNEFNIDLTNKGVRTVELQGYEIPLHRRTIQNMLDELASARNLSKEWCDKFNEIQAKTNLNFMREHPEVMAELARPENKSTMLLLQELREKLPVIVSLAQHRDEDGLNSKLSEMTATITEVLNHTFHFSKQIDNARNIEVIRRIEGIHAGMCSKLADPHGEHKDIDLHIGTDFVYLRDAIFNTKSDNLLRSGLENLSLPDLTERITHDIWHLRNKSAKECDSKQS